MSTSNQHKNALNQHCLEIIAEIEGKHYASVEFVVQVLLERYGVTQFEDLYVGTIHDIPALCLLAELQTKTNTFLQAYFSTRSIISYLDLDYEIARMLHSFSLPSMRSLQVSKTVNPPMVPMSTDPNEINLDDDPPLAADPAGPIISMPTTPPTVSSFTDFGLGPLYLHTLVSLYFPVQQYLQTISNTDGNNTTTTTTTNGSNSSSSSEVLDHFVTARDVLSCLASAETLPLSLTTANSDSLSSSAAVVESYLCEQYEVTSLLEVGIVLSGDMMLEMLMLSHVQAARLKLLAEIQKQQLNDFAQHEKDIVASTTTAKRKQQQQQQKTTESTKAVMPQIDACTLQLAVCPRTQVTEFVNKCVAGLGDGPYSPSFSKVEDVVRKVVTNQCANSNNSGRRQQDVNEVTTAGKGQRKKRRTQSSDGDGSITGTADCPVVGPAQHKDNDFAPTNTVGGCRCCSFVVEALTDYVMLHVGSAKYRGKRFITASKPSDEASEGGSDTDASKTVVTSCCASSSSSATSSYCSVDFAAASAAEGSPNSPSSVDAVVACADAPVDESMVLSDHGHVPLVSVEEQHERSTSIPVPVCTVSTTTTSSSSSNQNHANDGSLSGELTEQQRQPLFECKLFSVNNNKTDSSSGGGGGGLRIISASELKHLAPWSPRSETAGVGWSLDPSDLKAVGRWGEALVYQYLMQQNSSPSLLPLKSATADFGSSSGNIGNNQGRVRHSATVEWLNEQEESRASYDLILRERVQTAQSKDRDSRCIGQWEQGPSSNSAKTVTMTTYIEVKTTRFDELNVFELSLWEWQFATANPRVRYHIYRVFSAGDMDKVRIVVVEDVLQMITERRVKLCLAV